jgi:hypothetical protein
MEKPERPTCAYCGAKAPRVTEFTRPSTTEYKGNLIVTKHHSRSSIKGTLHWYTLWDGESYKLNYDPFCKLRCAEKFAKLAYKKGYRIQN